MSITAVRFDDAYSFAPSKSGSAQLPDFMILFGAYMTALMPSIGLVLMLLHAHVPGVITRVFVSGPASKMRPSESWKRNG